MSNEQKALNTKPTVINRSDKRAGLWRMFLLGFILMIAGGWLLYLQGNNAAGPLVLTALGVMAMIGVMFLFFLVMGFIQLTTKRDADDFARTLVDEMDSGLMVTDQHGRIVYSNEAYAEMINAKTVEDVVSIETVFTRQPEASEIVYRMANHAKDGDISVEEFRLPSGLKSNEEGARWFRLRARPMAATGFKEPLTVWQASDVTRDRLKHETAFQDLQNAINYLDHAPAGFFSSDQQGALLYLNATLADWLGIDLVRFLPGSINLRDIVVGEGMALLESIKPGDKDITTAIIDLDFLKSDGKSLPVRLYHKVPFAIDGSPGATRTLVINRGVVGDNEDELRAAEVRFTRFFNNNPMAIAAVNSDGIIVRTNAPFQRLFSNAIRIGNSEKSGSGLKYTKLVAKEDSKALKKVVKAALEGVGRIEPVEMILPNSNEQSVRFYVSPVTDIEPADESSIVDDERAIIYAMDTTDQRALEQQFAQGQKMQAVGQLAGGVAHDFNNVLTAIIGFSDLLLVNHRPSDPAFQDIMNIKQNANRAASLVRQLLAFSRRQTLRPQVLQLPDVLSDLRILLDRLLGEKVNLDVVYGRDLWPIKADISQFEQVIVNLSVNARDAMPEGGNLKITSSNLPESECGKRFNYRGLAAADYVMLEITDDGIGMPGEVQDKIFEPFYTTKEVGKGTGLGLSTVYGIVKQTGGSIYPDSEEGRGTTFRLFLPRHIMVAEETEPENSESKTPEKKQDLSGTARILLVEDEDAVRAFASRALSSRGYEVHVAINGAEALEVMEDLDGEVDLIVSDVVMPEMDGPTLLTEIRKDHPDLKFVFMSGYAEEAFSKNLPEKEQGNFGFLPKPYTLKQLATTVKEMLE
ncbi:MAG: response regulator [Hyphomicrobiales bacterium]|nr:response regulator [Hyphomicrobiales bacterium]